MMSSFHSLACRYRFRLQCLRELDQSFRILKPLALLLHARIIPGSQLENALEDLGYRVVVSRIHTELIEKAKALGPMVGFVDLTIAADGSLLKTIKAFVADDATSHVPLVAYCPKSEKRLRDYAGLAGAKLTVEEETLLKHLPEFLEQALRLD